MDLSAKTKIDDLLTRYPFLEDFFIGKSPKFKNLRNPIMRKTIGKIASLEKVAAMGGLDLDALLSDIAQEIKAHTDEAVTLGADGELGNVSTVDSEKKQQILKDIILELHDGKDVEAVKKRFKTLVQEVSPSEIANMEQQLIEEGSVSEGEIKRLCDVHAAVFQDSLEKQPLPEVPDGHPVHTFMAENRAAEKVFNDIDSLLEDVGDGSDRGLFNKNEERLAALLNDLSPIDIHYLRKENQLFPLLEAHDISGPSQVMWAIHDDIRALLKKLREQPLSADPPATIATVKETTTAIREMVYKEEHILFPMSLETLSESDWIKVRTGEEEIGYAWVLPGAVWPENILGRVTDQSSGPAKMGTIDLDMGHLTPEQINLMLTHMPVDMTFVDENDTVAYYSQGKERIFPRSPGIIGRKVQKCHPPDSVHIVEKILDAFKSGERDTSEFWIQLGGRFIYIRYFAMRSSSGEYKGCLEVSQEITNIRKIEGEQRLLDWE
jgi:DUF438 domain-containing protein